MAEPVPEPRRNPEPIPWPRAIRWAACIFLTVALCVAAVAVEMLITSAVARR